ncbi:ATP-binding protein [Natranaerobius thermophilus]|uniref:histidine kinase n=1 Tax=Natranaerobius thermophilus (strain ATCC BAA-1301 / DSM 18059 / JW/NM-WN-LF) TaxID=457570 RepID=B2A4S7_NATTJ|nr:ATP-binding protein [Natranaerobius thermophilus]ACB83849.1 multi-sensor signal transduction histidine kinase [Natranaerobius thermophilus JW/NM-WN-LF]
MLRSIRIKILGVIALLLIVLAINSSWAVNNFQMLDDSIEAIMQANYRSVDAAQNMIVALERQDSAILTYLFEEDEDISQTFREHEREFMKWFTLADDNITEVDEPEIIENIDNSYAEFALEFNKLQNIQVEEGTDAARQHYYDQVFPKFEDAKDFTRRLLELNQNKMLELQGQAETRASNATKTTAIISILTVVTGTVLALYISGKITRPIRDLTKKMEKVSQGDYQQQLDIQGNDEIVKLADSFNTMAKQLNEYTKMNVSKLKREKQKAEAIVQSIGDGIIVTNEDNKIILVNKAAEDVFDIREKEVIDTHFLEALNNQEIFDLIKKSKDESQLYYKSYTDISMIKDGDTNYYRIIVNPIKAKDSKTMGVITLIQDITKLKKVDELKSQFVSTVSHEFRTPLTSINMSIGLLLDKIPGDINDDQKELLQVIQEDSERLNRLVNELLDLSRIESGKMQMDFDYYDIKNIIQHAVKPLRIQAEEKNIQIKINVSDNLPKVRADHTKIGWVVSNLVGNALRYTPTDGTGVINIETKQTANKIVTSVTDNGSGISEEYQKIIFDKFLQVNGGESTQGGAGLGLAISREIVRAHGGDMWVDSELGEGSTFYFTLNM